MILSPLFPKPVSGELIGGGIQGLFPEMCPAHSKSSLLTTYSVLVGFIRSSTWKQD